MATEGERPRRGQGGTPGAGDPDEARDPQGGEQRSSAEVRTALIQGRSFGIRAVQYAVVDGDAIFEGDILLGSAEQVAAETEQLRAVASGQVALGVVISGAQFRWPNCVIPYDIDAALPNQARVTDAIAHWEANTRYRFVRRTAANQAQYPDWVTFRPGSGCSAQVGRRGGQQFVNLGGGCTLGNTIHEIGHVVGLWHEQSREDRDTFVTINWPKIQPGFEHNFNQHITDGDDVGAYDYGSIMHYPRNAFSVDGTDTIRPVDPAAQIGQRLALSAGDIAAANSLCPPKRPKEVVKDPLKEVAKDGRLDTRKELVKDVRLDTRKEQIRDTLKEQIRDTLKEQVRDTIKEAARDPMKGPADLPRPGGGVVPGPLTPGAAGGGALPFAVATPHHAPGADLVSGGGASGAGGADDLGSQIMDLDAQLQEIAEAIAEADVHRAALQQQYEELSVLVQQALDAHDQAGGA